MIDPRRASPMGPIVLVGLIFLIGCSSGYRTEFGNCVPYRYCPPAPLPYRDDCGCETPMAQDARTRLLRMPTDGAVSGMSEPGFLSAE